MGKKLQKAYELTDAEISFVSLVDKAANKHTFLIMKADNENASFTTYGRIVKADAESHFVTGIVYEPMAEDSQGNYMTEAEITKAAYWFAKNGNKVDLQHSFEPLENAMVVESWVAKADFTIEGQTVKKGTWLMTVEVTDEAVWDSIQKGEITGFSMGGVGHYSEENVALSDDGEKGVKGLLRKIADLISKAINEDTTLMATDNVSLSDNSTPFTDDKAVVEENIGTVEKQKLDTGFLKNEEVLELELTREELESLVRDVVASMMKEPEDNEPAVEKNDAEPVITEDVIEKMVQAAIEKALPEEPKEEPMTVEKIQEYIDSAVEKAVTPILKAKGLPTNLGNDVTKSEPAAEEHYLKGIL